MSQIKMWLIEARWRLWGAWESLWWGNYPDRGDWPVSRRKSIK